MSKQVLGRMLFWTKNLSNWRETRCLKITEKVSFNIASEASYIYILSGQKLIKNAKNGSFWKFLKSWNLLSNRSFLIRQKLLKNATYLRNFQTLYNCSIFHFSLFSQWHESHLAKWKAVLNWWSRQIMFHFKIAPLTKKVGEKWSTKRLLPNLKDSIPQSVKGNR